MELPECVGYFDRDLLDRIKNQFDHRIESIQLNASLAKDRCPCCGVTLLHHAARWGYDTIVRVLLGLGSQVDRTDEQGRSALMMSMSYVNARCARILLEAGADVLLADANGQSALRRALESPGCAAIDAEIVQAFRRGLDARSSTFQQLTDRLFRAGIDSWYRAVLTGDPALVAALQRRAGFDISERNGPDDSTALHLAVRMDHLEMAAYLVERGADVNALDGAGHSPFSYAEGNANLTMMHLLLDNGASPPAPVPRGQTAVATQSAARPKNILEHEQIPDCAELLLRYDTYPDNMLLFVRIAISTYGEEGLKHGWRGLDSLAAHLAIFVAKGTFTVTMEPHAHPRSRRYIGRVGKTYTPWAFVQLDLYYQRCRQILRKRIFRRLKVLDLLTASESKMRIYARNRIILSNVESLCCYPKVKHLFPYYCKLLIERLFKASRWLALEDQGISVICDLLGGGYNQLNVFARQVVTYLTVCDLEQLSLVNVGGGKT